MTIESAAELYAILSKCGAEGLYEEAKNCSKKYKHYFDGEYVSIDQTSETAMHDLLQKTVDTPETELDSMREKRKRAFEDLCYIYGGYIAWTLKYKWEKSGFCNIAEKEEYISLATGQLMENIMKTLERDGYKKGTFSHLVRLSISRKFRDLGKKYDTVKRRNSGNIPIETGGEIIGGAIGVIDENDQDVFNFDESDRELTAIGILNMLAKVKTKNSKDDHEMFVRLRIKGHSVEDIASDMGLSQGTVYRRVKNFTTAAIKLFHQYMADLEK